MSPINMNTRNESNSPFYMGLNGYLYVRKERFNSQMREIWDEFMVENSQYKTQWNHHEITVMVKRETEWGYDSYTGSEILRKVHNFIRHYETFPRAETYDTDGVRTTRFIDPRKPLGQQVTILVHSSVSVPRGPPTVWQEPPVMVTNLDVGPPGGPSIPVPSGPANITRSARPPNLVEADRQQRYIQNSNESRNSRAERLVQRNARRSRGWMSLLTMD
ncbi:hypothetical protein NHQ30_006551 [Ciborinia camelliae]|nr:hypothetical protein NHQ30_006551 [Ciborinia camelliae]